MAWDPAVVGFILAGLVGGVGAVMNASEGWEVSHELSKATSGWTALVVVRGYEGRGSSKRHQAREAATLAAHGYRPVLQRGGAPPADGRQYLPDPDPDAAVSVTFHLE